MEEFPSVVRNIFFIPASEGPAKENTLVKLHASWYTPKPFIRRESYSVCLCVGIYVCSGFSRGCSGRCRIMSQHTLIKSSLSELLQLTGFFDAHIVVALWILQVVINFHTNMKIHTLAKHTVTRVLVLNGTEVALWSLLIIYLCRMLPKKECWYGLFYMPTSIKDINVISLWFYWSRSSDGVQSYLCVGELSDKLFGLTVDIVLLGQRHSLGHVTPVACYCIYSGVEKVFAHFLISIF